MQHSFAGKLDLVPFLTDAFDHDLLAFVQLVTNVTNAPVGNFRDVQQPVSAWKDFDERAEINDAIDSADVSLANFGLRRQALDSVHGGFGCCGIGSRDRNRSVVFDIDLRAGLFNQSANDFAPWSDDVANLVRVDFDFDDEGFCGGCFGFVELHGGTWRCWRCTSHPSQIA